MLLSEPCDDPVEPVFVGTSNVLRCCVVVGVEGQGYGDGEEVDVGDVGLPDVVSE